MSAVCPNGHTSEAEDYCDTCGSPIDLAAQPAGASARSAASAGSAGAAGAAGSAGSAGPTPPTGSGSVLDLGPAGAAPAPPSGAGAGTTTAPTGLECPNCHTENAEGALFCEACGYDFTTGAMPRDPNAPAAGGAPDPGAGATATDGATGAAAATSPAGASSTPVGEGAAGGAAAGSLAATDFEWLAEVWIDPDWYQTQEPEDPCPSPGLPTIVPLRHTSVLLGRVSVSRNTHPEIDLSSDPGVSRRHAQLTTDGTRWFVEDLGSSNGTFVGPAAGPLPAQPIAVGPKTELEVDDRLYVGAWTRVVVRKATPDEVEAYA